MPEKSPVISFMGLNFNVTNCLSGILVCIIVFGFMFYLSRNVTFKPGKKQNLLESMIDFTNNIVKSNMPGEEGKPFYLYAFVLFWFILVSNILGLALEIKIDDYSIIKSPTSSPVVTLTLAMMSLLLAHFFGVKSKGFAGYWKSYAQPVSFLLPINLIEEFTNYLTLSLRLYGNIFAGEVLLALIGQVAGNVGVFGSIFVIPFEMIWQAFSIFIGTIQAYIFTTLSMVYISHKVEK